jgi:anti-sigma B factor antagonist
MEIKIRNFNSIYIVDITGEIDLYNYSKLKETVILMKSKGIKNYILNFENVTYIDSSGIGTLIFIHTTLKEAKCNLCISNIHGPVKRVIELTKLVGFLPIAETIQDSIKKISKDNG